MQNANYSETWTDYVSPSGNIKIVRTYNSRALYDGMFGFGWCSEFESKIRLLPDGMIARVQCGAGTEVPFKPLDYDNNDYLVAVDAIVGLAKLANPSLTEDEFVRFRYQLQRSSEKLAAEADYYGYRPAMKEGTIFVAQTEETDKIVYQNHMFTRFITEVGIPPVKREIFDSDGNLVRVVDESGSYISYYYHNNALKNITSSVNNESLQFKTNSRGKILSAMANGELIAEYEVDESDNLVSATNGKNERYEYQYDSLHNLIKLTYPDLSVKEFKFDTDKDWVIGLVDQNGCEESYNYTSSTKPPISHSNGIVLRKCDGEPDIESTYDFWYKQRTSNPNSRFLYRVMYGGTNIQETEAIYHEEFARPVYIREGTEEKFYTFYANSFLKSKKTGDEFWEYEYDWRIGKVNKVITNGNETRFLLDAAGKIDEIADDSGLTIHFMYDNLARISQIRDSLNRVLNFTYNEPINRPSAVGVNGIGEQAFTYDSFGQIDQIHSSNNDPNISREISIVLNEIVKAMYQVKSQHKYVFSVIEVILEKQQDLDENL